MIIPAWLLGAGLVAVGIFLLIRGIRRVLKAVGGSVLLKLPLAQRNGRFVLPNTGDYAIWQSGRTLLGVPTKMPLPVITSQQTAEKIRVSPVFSSMRVSNGWERRIQLFTFRADTGQYDLELPMDTPSAYIKSPYFLEIREQRPSYWLVLGVLTIILAAACIIAGLILPFLSRMN